MIARRKPTTTPKIFDETYSPKVVEAIVTKTGLQICRSDPDWLRRSLDANAYFYGVNCENAAAKEKTTTGAWLDFIEALKDSFQGAFGWPAKATLDGPFCRFALAAMAHIGIVDVTAQAIRDALRNKAPKASRGK